MAKEIEVRKAADWLNKNCKGKKFVQFAKIMIGI